MSAGVHCLESCGHDNCAWHCGISDCRQNRTTQHGALCTLDATLSDMRLKCINCVAEYGSSTAWPTHLVAGGWPSHRGQTLPAADAADHDAPYLGEWRLQRLRSPHVHTFSHLRTA